MAHESYEQGNISELNTATIYHSEKLEPGRAEIITKKATSRRWIPPYTPPGEVDLFYITEILRALYGSPDHGNPDDPMDDLIYLLLTRKTPISKGRRAFYRLQKTVNGNWGNLLLVPRNKLKKILTGLGLVETRIDSLLQVVHEIKKRFGSPDLSKLHRYSNSRCFDFLVSLPGVGPKTARCVMMYALRRKVFPADSHCIRILARVGYIPESLTLNHKRAQEVLAQLVPGKLAYDLHVNLVAHGQTVCTYTRPDCEVCSINKFCMKYRGEREKLTNMETPAVIDLFCGAGGTGYGLSQTGPPDKRLRVSVAVDIDRWATKTYWINHPELPADRVLTSNLHEEETLDKIRELTKDDNVILVIGGPPCQDFSLIGTKGRKSTRPVNGKKFIELEGNENYAAFVKVVRTIKPLFFVMENVPGILAANGGRAREEIPEDFSDLYFVKSLLVDASDFGVPQRRVRFLLFGVKKDENGNNIAAKNALDLIVRHMQCEEKKVKKPVTFGQAVSDLPPLEQGQGFEFALFKKRPGIKSRYQKSMDGRSGLLFNHVARPNNVRDLKLYKLLKPGETAAHAIEKYRRPELMIYRNDVFKDKYKKQVWNKPSTTIVAHLAKDGHMFIHPQQIRSITVREAARLQSFPDDFIFCGQRTEQFKQVGNAVPPLMAGRIREAIVEAYKIIKLGG
ncbi:DNA (cytosine-5-)-methyltransferase [Desulfallas sp. Bu1-1]|uniref:DNA (cytosine-5-)-methyltransferase n=1 Tax=Desulfallas sp. Bu1-1 TaxID=2787620 RepID=UPI00189CD5DF|nr:DNA (cytosine-5-)-methyltransferase [Desulfallas sp. Bu1-1]MBF7084354.1 DNA (cytosine-5-)-methyltransferase [Desulfallas sp. Bu1-1]